MAELRALATKKALAALAAVERNGLLMPDAKLGQRGFSFAAASGTSRRRPASLAESLAPLREGAP